MERPKKERGVWLQLITYRTTKKEEAEIQILQRDRTHRLELLE